MPETITLDLPLRLHSTANLREHWAAKAKRAKAHRAAGRMVLKVGLPCTVTITRKGPRKLDGDNCAIAAKNLRDGIADKLGADDGDDRITWQYRQEKSKTYGVRIEIES